MPLDVAELRAIFTGDVSNYEAARRRVETTGRQLDGKRYRVKFDADTSPLDTATRRAEERLAAVARDTTIFKIDADISRAQARIRDLEGRRGEINLDVDAEVAKAEAEIRALQARRRNITLGLEVQAGSAVAQGFAIGRAIGNAAKAGIISSGVGAALGIAMAGAAAAGPAIVGVGAALGITGGLALQTGRALKAYASDQKAAETAAGGAAGQEVSNAIAIRNAQRAIEDARRSAARAAVDAGDAVEDAGQAVARAERDAAKATREVTEARADALRMLEDLTEKVDDFALTEARAQLSVEQALEKQKQVNADAAASDLDRRDAALDVAEAQERLSDIQREGARDAADLVQANLLGVEGSKQVVSAKESEQAAHERVADAQEALAEAQEQARRASEDGARAVADAVQNLADVQAQQAAASSAGAAGLNEFAREMEKLTPEGRAFVEQLISMQDMATRLGAEMQRSTLPGFTRLLEAGEKLEPVLAHGIRVTGDAMSDTADRAAQLVASPAFQEDLWDTFEQGADIVRATGDAAVTMFSDWISYAAEAEPATEGLVDLIGDLRDGWGAFLAGTLPGMEAYGELLDTTGDIARDTMGAFGRLLSTAAVEGAPLLNQARDLWRQLLQVIESAAASGLPTMMDAWGVLFDILSGVLRVLEPVAPMIGDIVGVAVPFIAAMKAVDKLSFGAVSDGLRGFKTDIDNAEGARGKLGAGMSGMVGAVFNPWTIALGIAAFALFQLGEDEAKARKRAAEHEAGVKDLTQALRESNGVIDESIRKKTEQALSDKNAYGNAKALGMAMGTVTDAAQGNAAAMGDVRSKSDQLIQSIGQQNGIHQDWINQLIGVNHGLLENGGAFDTVSGAAVDAFFSYSNLSDAQRNQLIATLNLTGAVGDQNRQFGTASQNQKDLAASTNSITYQQGLAQATTRDLGALIKTMGDHTKSAAERGQAMLDFLDELNGNSPSYEDAVQKLNDRYRDLGDLFKTAEDRARGWGQALINADGSINTTTANGSRLRDIMRDMGSATLTAAQAAYDLAIKQGADVPTAMAAANQVVTDQHGRLMTLAESMGISSTEMQKLLDKYNLTPEDVMTVIGQPGMENAQNQADIYKGKLDALTKPVITPVSANVDAARRTVETFFDQMSKQSFTVHTAPDGTQWRVNRNGPDMFAKGGSFGPGGPIVVGEEGPEIIWPDKGGFVSTAKQTAEIVANMDALNSLPAPRMPALAAPAAPPVAARGGDGMSMAAAVAAIRQSNQQVAAALSRLGGGQGGDVVVRIGNREVARAGTRGNLLDGRR